jgi:hypothetical protein
MQIPQTNLYEHDFYAWSLDMAAKIRNKQFDVLDIENIAEEIESLAGRDRRELYSRMVVLLAHLLKWEFQPSLRCGSWRGSINTQRREINLILADSPSLKARVIELAQNDKIFQEALETVVNETGLPPNILPVSNSYNLADILNVNFYPNE